MQGITKPFRKMATLYVDDDAESLKKKPNCETNIEGYRMSKPIVGIIMQPSDL